MSPMADTPTDGAKNWQYPAARRQPARTAPNPGPSSPDTHNMIRNATDVRSAIHAANGKSWITGQPNFRSGIRSAGTSGSLRNLTSGIRALKVAISVG